jgi:YD repeat-containing protein
LVNFNSSQVNRQPIVTYDSLGRIKQQQLKGINATDDITTTYTYNDRNNTTTIARPEGVSQTIKRDGRGNIIRTDKTVNGNNQTTSYTYNGINKLTLITDALGNTTQYEYNSLGHQITSTATDTQTSAPAQTTYSESNNLNRRTEYNEFGAAIAMTQNYGGVDPRTTTYEYDKLGRKKKTLDPLGHITTTTYDQLKNISQIEHSRNRSPVNCFVNILCGLIAYCHQPKKPGIAMEDHLLSSA